MIAIVVALVIPMFVPLMIVREMAPIAVPVSFKESLSIVTGRYPACAFISRLRPISIVPFVMVAGRIPVARDPKIPGAGTSRLYPDDTGRWRCADLIPIETWAKSVPPANNINTLNLVFTIRVLFSRLHFRTMSYQARYWPDAVDAGGQRNARAHRETPGIIRCIRTLR